MKLHVLEKHSVTNLQSTSKSLRQDQYNISYSRLRNTHPRKKMNEHGTFVLTRTKSQLGGKGD
jgi:hypothetical protein